MVCDNIRVYMPFYFKKKILLQRKDLKYMDMLHAALYGLIQGLTEFLPVSSSGHLALAQGFFGGANMETDYMAFDILLHFGTLLAVFVAYGKTILRLIYEFITMCQDIVKGKGPQLKRYPYRKMVVMLILSIIPLFAILPIKDAIDSLYTNTFMVGLFLCITAFILYVADIQTGGKKNVQTARLGDGFKVGIFQAFATLPGISRSGSTIAAGMLCGFEKEFAVEFAFIMSIPAIIGANLLHVGDLLTISASQVLPYLVGTVVAAVSGFCAIKLLDFIAKRKNFRIFSYYCVIMGIVAMVLSLFK